MSRRVARVALLLVTILVANLSAFIHTHYSVVKHNVVAANWPSYSVKETSNLATCGLFCLQDNDCASAIYSPLTNQCSLYKIASECTMNHDSDLIQLKKVSKVPFAIETTSKIVYDDCQDVHDHGITVEGFYQIRGHSRTVSVLCKFSGFNGWTVIQRRMDGSENFYRGWDDYVSGFGNVSGEYWLGLDDVYHLTTIKKNQKLNVLLEDHQGNARYAEYSTFYIDSCVHQYTAHISGYRGNAGDSMQLCNKRYFTTSDLGGCAAQFKGGWWFAGCHHSHLNGKWIATTPAPYAQGLVWYHWTGYYYSLKGDVMAITRN